MIKNYFKTAFRNLVRNKVYSVLNILGLTIGISCFSLIMLHVENDFSFDQFHENESYRLLYNQEMGAGDYRKAGIASLAQGQELADNVAGIKDKLFMRDFNVAAMTISYKDKKLNTGTALFAEDNFFEFFSFNLLQGDPASALSDPTGLIITQSLANGLFGNQNPMGEFIKIDGIFELSLKITGVIEDPTNTSLKFKIIFPFEAQMEGGNVITRSWMSQSMYTYYRLDGNNNKEEVEGRMKAYLESSREGAALEEVKKETLLLQPVSEMYFDSSDVTFDGGYNKGDKQNILILAAIGAFILLVACINYINISTAKAMTRIKEIGVRKVLGAQRKQLVGQFMGEALLITLVAVLISVLITDLTLPAFNNVLGKALRLELLQNPFFYQLLIGLLFFVTLFSGLYPAAVLSAFKTSESLKGKNLLKGGRLRQGLIAVQLFVTLVLISSVLLIMKQSKYMNTMDLGFEKENILNINMISDAVRKNMDSYNTELLRNPNFISTTIGTDVMGPGNTNNSYYAIPEGKTLADGTLATYFSIGMDFLKLHEIEIVAGRNFDPALSSDSVGLIINESLASSLGFENPIGEKIKIWGEGTTSQTIIGVARNFNFQSLHSAVNPALFTIAQRNIWSLTAKIAPGSTKAALDYASAQWDIINPGQPFTYNFVDDQLDKFYSEEKRTLNVIQSFAIICIVIACMGLYGMTAFTIEQKLKEIGIRKVLGAGVNQLVWMVNKKFVMIFLVASLLAIPLVYYAINLWLEGFAYHTTIGFTAFLITGITVLAIVIATVSGQAIKAAWTNPTKTLGHE
jgi:putative ABC transport system permease protein